MEHKDIPYIALESVQAKDERMNRRLYEPLAEEFDLSVQQVKNIIYKSQYQLFKHIN